MRSEVQHPAEQLCLDGGQQELPECSQRYRGRSHGTRKITQESPQADSQPLGKGYDTRIAERSDNGDGLRHHEDVSGRAGHCQGLSGGMPEEDDADVQGTFPETFRGHTDGAGSRGAFGHSHNSGSRSGYGRIRDIIGAGLLGRAEAAE